MGKILGTIMSKSGRQYSVKWEQGEVWVMEQGEIEWFCVGSVRWQTDALKAAKEFVDSQDPAF